MMPISSGDKDYDLGILIGQTSQALSKARRKELVHNGVTLRQSALLFYVAILGEKVTLRQIARARLREPNSITEQVNRMVKQGLVKKTKDLQRRNMVHVALTDEGRDVYKKTTKRDSVHRVMSALSEAEKKTLKPLLEKLRNAAMDEVEGP